MLVDADARRTDMFHAGAESSSDEALLPVPGYPTLTLRLERVWRGLGTQR